MYKVKEWHCRPVYRKGDLESEEVVTDVATFKTKKEAKEFVEKKLLKGTKVERRYKTGNEKSYCWYYTGKEWTNENTGETCKECFTYELYKE